MEVGEEVGEEEVEREEEGVAVITNNHISSSTNSGAETSKDTTTFLEYVYTICCPSTSIITNHTAQMTFYQISSYGFSSVIGAPS